MAKVFPVFVKNNPQLLMYLLGAVVSVNLSPGQTIEKFVATIIQPRRMDNHPKVQSVTYSKEQLQNFRRELFDAAAETLKPNAPLNPGDWCRWCTALPFCKAAAKKQVEVAKEVFDLADNVSPNQLSIAELTDLLNKEKEIKEYFASIRTYVRDMLLSGKKVPGYKLAPGRRQKKWNSKEKVEEFIRDKKIVADINKLTPAAVQKALGGNLPRDLWHWEEGPPQIKVDNSAENLAHARSVFDD